MSIQSNHTIRHGKPNSIEYHHVAGVDKLVIDLIVSMGGCRERWIQENAIRSQ